MKIFTILTSLGSAALLICTTIGCKTVNETERPQMSTVIALSGNVQCWNDSSNRVYTIKVGNRLPPGLTIRTGSGEGNYVDLATGKQTRFFSTTRYLDYDPTKDYFTYSPADWIRIYPNSVLKLDKITLRAVGKNRIPDTSLVLLQGSVLFSTSTAPNPKDKTTIPQSHKPNHEIRSSNIVIHAESAGIFFAASGLTQVFGGAAIVERTDQGTTNNLTAWQQYDPVTGRISSIEKKYMYYGLFPHCEDWFRWSQPRRSAFDVPPKGAF